MLVNPSIGLRVVPSTWVVPKCTPVSRVNDLRPISISARRFTLFKTRFDFPEKIVTSIRFRKTNARAARVRHGGVRAH